LNKDGKVSFEEFKTVVNKYKGEPAIKKIFDSYDTNKDGFVDAHELLCEYDLNKDGKVSFEEYKKVMKKYKGLDEATLKTKFQALDVDKSGFLDAAELLAEFDLNKDKKVSFDEFKTVTLKYKGDSSLRSRFDAYDTNKDGMLDAKELLAEFDLNKDGKVTFAEFEKIWKKFK